MSADLGVEEYLVDVVHSVAELHLENSADGQRPDEAEYRYNHHREEDCPAYFGQDVLSFQLGLRQVAHDDEKDACFKLKEKQRTISEQLGNS